MLHLRNLSYHPTVVENAILKDIDLDLPAQQLGVIVGPSGSGKSTLMEILAGLAEHTSGSLFWREQELNFLYLQQLCGIVFQFPERHFCGGTILEELRLGHPEVNSDRLREVLTEVGLEEIPLQASPHDLSGGQQRRLGIAVQLVRQPHILLLDEPTAGLDWSSRRQLVTLLAKLKQNWTLLVVSHDAAEVLEIADCAWRIEGGKVQSVTVETLRSQLVIPECIA
jgi:energy-coupling factor transport system ATP-binding protein